MPRRYVERTQVLGSVSKALERGALEVLGPKVPSHDRHGTPVPYSWKLKYAGNCSAPVTIYRDGVRLTKRGGSRVFGRHPLERPVMTETEARCRKCDNCLKARAAHWRLRALDEFRAAERTWFGTLTLSPDAHMRVLLECRAADLKNGDDFDARPEGERFAKLHARISKEITLAIKRLRETSKAELRLLCVCEVHKSGLPHYHMLVHERVGQPVKHRQLKECWRWGYTLWKLVDVAACGYVTKYLAKSIEARVRASLHYGKTA